MLWIDGYALEKRARGIKLFAEPVGGTRDAIARQRGGSGAKRLGWVALQMLKGNGHALQKRARGTHQ